MRVKLHLFKAALAAFALLLGASVAGADAATPQEESQRFDRELTQAGVPHRTVVYEGAPHSFFDRTFAEHREACEDAWRQMLDFMKENSATD